MAFAITDRVQDGVAILSLSGRLVEVQEKAQIMSRFEAHMKAGRQRLILDVTNLDWTNDSLPAVSIATKIAIEKAGGRFALAGPNRRIKEFLEHCRIAEVIGVYADVTEVLESDGW